MNTPIRRVSFYNTAVATEHYLGMRWPKAVWEEVLKQAIDDVILGPTPEELSGWGGAGGNTAWLANEIRAAAQSWIDDDINEPRRFVWVCEQLDLNPAAVRVAINRKKGAKSCPSS